MIKDSGERREFETGAVRDMAEGKGRMDLLPWAAIMEVSKHCENGAKKYGEHNVDKGIETHSFCDSAARHLAKYMDGQTDEPHLLAAAWNLLWCIQMELKHPELCDVPWREKEEAEDLMTTYDEMVGEGLMIRNKKALDAAQVIAEYCKEQRVCQNCIFRQHGADHWECHIEAFDLQDVLSNIEAKKKTRGYI